ALPVLVAGEAPGDDDPVGRDGHGVERLAAGSAERRRLDLLPLPAVGRPPGDAVLVALDGARAHRHEALAERGDPGDRLLAGPVERPAGAAVDGPPGLAAVPAEPPAGADLAPDVLAPGDGDAPLAGRARGGPLAVLAAHDLGGRPLPAVVGPAPDGGVGLLAVADLADRQQPLAGGDDRGQRLAPGRGAVADELRLPVAGVVRGPDRRPGHRPVGVEDRADDRPRLALPGGGQEAGDGRHRLAEAERRALGPAEGRGRLVPRGLGAVAAGGGRAGPGPGGEGGDGPPAPRAAGGAGPAGRLAGPAGQHAGVASSAGCGVQGESSGAWSAPHPGPSGRRFSLFGERTVQSRPSCRHDRGPQVKVGVLALQGASARHVDMLARAGAAPVEVRTPADLDAVDAVVLPGGESTTMSMLLESSGLADPLAARLADGMPAFGTCAGMILLGREVLDGRPDQRCFGAVDVTVRRNAFGRQVDSFEADLPVEGLAGGPVHAVFIRAPVVEAVGPAVEVLAT